MTQTFKYPIFIRRAYPTIRPCNKANQNSKKLILIDNIIAKIR